ncbi:hypothetical protein PR202_ga00443 [Eleusine coracana subsp. coracana]|uniref:Beta-amylase n=1 Tax=Eleusine coracana subsp. coracana TaxID=191504 RepID=A0AAV5BGI9_ELECO|nr:hypothetical protein PR202_ga00443 [Eleusine coracana subsp. coracana]
MAFNLAQSTAAAASVAPCTSSRRVAAPSSVSMRKPASSAGSLRLQRQACCEPSVAPAMSVACKAVAESAAAAGRKIGVPVFVMMPLDTVKKCGSALNRRKAVQASLTALKSAGVEGVMVDVWWGIAEAEGPGRYNFAGYMELMEMARKTGLKVQAVMSFHQCGGNVGDSVTIPLPRWVVEEMERDNDLCYTDQWGHRNLEYVSLGCDAMPVLKGRTPVECYTDFMRAFRDHFADYLSNTIVEIQVGMGPAGELRYPSYPESNGIWKFPGIGAFQCNDRYMLSSLKAAAEATGKPEWGHAAPTDAGGYHSWPEDTLFFKRDNGGWSTEYGDFFLSWYSQMLIDHGDRVLTGATSVYSGTPGVEMRDGEQPQDAQCRPEALVRQVASAARAAGVGLAGENALPRYDGTAHDQVVATAAQRGDAQDRMVAFTYLRMGPDLFHPDNWHRFAAFVRRMSGAAGYCREAAEREARGVAQATGSLVHEAAVALRS